MQTGEADTANLCNRQSAPFQSILSCMIKEANVTIMVKDMNTSIAFYQALGLTLKQRWNNHYTQLSTPGIVIGLHPADQGRGSGTSGNVSIGFTTGNFEEALSHLKTLNVEVTTRNEEGGQFIHFKDPDGSFISSSPNGSF